MALCLVAGCASWFLPYDLELVPAAAETEPMFGTADQADDPAFWLHPSDPSLSVILGTNKEGGLYAYNLAGELQGILDVGRNNNVDVRGDLAVASNDEVNGLSWFRIVPTDTGARIQHLGDTTVRRYEPYGVCLGVIDGELQAGITYPNGAFELWGASDQGTRVVKELLRTERFASQIEGCVFDDAGKRLFIGEEDHGVWSLDLSDPGAPPREVDTIAAGNGLVEDVEGLSLYAREDGSGYLVVSAQGADRFVLYERRPPHDVIGAIRIVSSIDGTVDGVSHTDGVEAVAVSLPGYPHGLLIVQDDANPKIEKDQNFKLVDWRDVENALALPVR